MELERDTLDAITNAFLALDDGDEELFAKHWRQVPVPIRAVASVSYLAGIDGSMSERNVGRVGGFSPGATGGKHKPALTVLRDALPSIMQHLADEGNSQVTKARLAADAQAANAAAADASKIAGKTRTTLDAVLRYAAALHADKRNELMQNLREREQKVRDIRPSEPTRLAIVPTEEKK